jgi:hypothetical protein
MGGMDFLFFSIQYFEEKWINNNNKIENEIIENNDNLEFTKNKK